MSLRIAPTLRTAALRRAAPRVAAPMLRRGNASAAGGQGQQQQHNQGKQGGGSKLPLILAALAVGGGAYYYFAEKKPAEKAQAVKEHTKADYEKVYQDIADTLEKEGYDDGSLAPVVLRLAWHASGTYNKDDKTGGSNYATMRFPAESGHGANAGLGVARDYLEKIHQKYPWISYGDLWTLAGVAAIQEAGGPVIPWSPGRVDGLEVNQTPDGRLPDASQGAQHIRDIFGRMGFNDQETVALIGAHALGRCHTDRSGYDGPWTYSPTSWSNELYRLMLDKGQKWHFKKWKGPQQFENNDKQLMMLPTDMVLISDKGFRPWVEKYANDEDAFNKDFAKAFKTLIELGVPKENLKTQQGWAMGQEDDSDSKDSK